MSSSLRSLSQIWNKNSRLDTEEVINDVPAVNGSGSRRQLSRQFKSVSDATKTKEEQPPEKRLLRSRGVLSSISNLNVSNVPKETRKLLQAGADKVNQTLSDVRSTLGTWSQVWNQRNTSGGVKTNFHHFSFTEIEESQPTQRKVGQQLSLHPRKKQRHTQN